MAENPETLALIPSAESFDPETQEGTSVLSVGWYEAEVIEALVCQPKSGDGCQITLIWQIIADTYRGRQVWQNLTFQHSNAQAVAFGRQRFKDLCVATGISEQVTDVSVFKFVPCKMKLGIEQDKQGVYPDRNKVLSIRPLEEKKPEAKKVGMRSVSEHSETDPKATTAKPTAAAPATKPAPTAGDGAAPWRKPAKPTSTGDATDNSSPY